MHRRITHLASPSLLACVAFVLATPAAAQTGAISIVVGGAQTRDTEGESLATGEVRWEPRPTALSPVLIGGFQVNGNGCAESLPPQCSLPAEGAIHLRAGLVGTRSAGGTELLLTPTVGVIRWGGAWDPSLRLEAGIRIDLGRGVQLETGVRGERIWLSDRSGEVLVGARAVDSIGLVLGLRFTSAR